VRVGVRVALRNPRVTRDNHYLPLTPSAAHSQPVRTPHDLVLPPAAAFSMSTPTYPIFTTVDCTWQYILDRVVNPSALWSSYAPGSLGDYPDIKSIWQTWDEGAYIKNVGHKPAVHLIDARWGNLESQETHKHKYSSWRRRNDTKVSTYLIFTLIHVGKFIFFFVHIGPKDLVEFLFLYLSH